MIKIASTYFTIYEQLKKNIIQIILHFFNLFLIILNGKLIAKYYNQDIIGVYNIEFGLFALIHSFTYSPFLQYLKNYYTNYKFILLNSIVYSIILFFITFLFLFNLYYYNILTSRASFLLIFFLLICNFINSVICDYFNLIGDLKKYSLIMLLRNIFQFIILLFYFILDHSSIDYQLYILWLSQLLPLLISLLFLKFDFKKFSFKIFDFRIYFNKVNSYIFPLMIMSIFTWFITFIDKFFIKYFLGFSSVAIYNVNFSLGAKIFLTLNSFFLLFITPKVYSASDFCIKKKIIYKYTIIYIFISVPILLILSFTYMNIGFLLLSENYKSGFYLIIISSISYFILTSCYLLELLFYSENITKYILYSNICASSIIVIFNLLFIKNYGISATGFSILIAFIFKYIFLIFISNKSLYVKL